MVVEVVEQGQQRQIKMVVMVYQIILIIHVQHMLVVVELVLTKVIQAHLSEVLVDLVVAVKVVVDQVHLALNKMQ